MVGNFEMTSEASSGFTPKLIQHDCSSGIIRAGEAERYPRPTMGKKGKNKAGKLSKGDGKRAIADLRSRCWPTDTRMS